MVESNNAEERLACIEAALQTVLREAVVTRKTTASTIDVLQVPLAPATSHVAPFALAGSNDRRGSSRANRRKLPRA
jgi:hypothetical protein